MGTRPDPAFVEAERCGAAREPRDRGLQGGICSSPGRPTATRRSRRDGLRLRRGAGSAGSGAIGHDGPVRPSRRLRHGGAAPRRRRPAATTPIDEPRGDDASCGGERQPLAARSPATPPCPRLRIIRRRYHQPIDVASASRRECSRLTSAALRRSGRWRGQRDEASLLDRLRQGRVQCDPVGHGLDRRVRRRSRRLRSRSGRSRVADDHDAEQLAVGGLMDRLTHPPVVPDITAGAFATHGRRRRRRRRRAARGLRLVRPTPAISDAVYVGATAGFPSADRAPSRSRPRSRPPEASVGRAAAAGHVAAAKIVGTSGTHVVVGRDTRARIGRDADLVEPEVLDARRAADRRPASDRPRPDRRPVADDDVVAGVLDARALLLELHHDTALLERLRQLLRRVGVFLRDQRRRASRG